ncbi:MAG: helix-turn-helix transcriptional regulator [Bacteriovoracales bacterium]|nr:helix-turn-helix transcriptional regulator [Bacteriovoracales bacterium]
MDKNKNDFLKMVEDFFPGKMTPGEIIRAKRKNYGITLEEVEEVTGISQSNLSLYENNKKSIGYVQATKIGLAVGLNPMTILFPNGIEGDSRFKETSKKSSKLLTKKIPLKKIA